MIKELTKLATYLDAKGLIKEANAVDAIIRKLAINLDDIMDGPNPGLTPEKPGFNPADTATEPALQLDFSEDPLEDGVLTGSEVKQIGSEMMFNEWKAVVEEITKKQAEADERGSGWVPLYLSEDEVSLRMKLKDSGWTDEELSKARAEIDPKWAYTDPDTIVPLDSDEPTAEESSAFVRRMINMAALGEELMKTLEDDDLGEDKVAARLKELDFEDLKELKDFVDGYLDFEIEEDEDLLTDFLNLISGEMGSRGEEDVRPWTNW